MDVAWARMRWLPFAWISLFRRKIRWVNYTMGYMRPLNESRLVFSFLTQSDRTTMHVAAVFLLSLTVYVTGMPPKVEGDFDRRRVTVTGTISELGSAVTNGQFYRTRRAIMNQSPHSSKFQLPQGLRSILIQGSSSEDTDPETVGQVWDKMALHIPRLGDQLASTFRAHLTESGNIRVPIGSTGNADQWKDLPLSIKPIWNLYKPAKSSESQNSNSDEDDEDDIDFDNSQHSLYDKVAAMCTSIGNFQSKITGLSRTVLRLAANLPTEAKKITKFSINVLSNTVHRMINVASALGIFNTQTGHLLLSAFGSEGEVIDIDTLDIKGDSAVVEKFKSTLKQLMALKETGIQEVYLLGGLGAAVMNLLADKAILAANRISPILKGLGMTGISQSLDLTAQMVIYFQDQMSAKLLGHLLTNSNQYSEMPPQISQNSPKQLW